MLAEQFDAFLFDLDGAVYVGEEPTPGAVETLERLRERGAAIRFLTNNPRPTRQQVADRLTAMGVEAAVEEIVTSGWATAQYVTETGAETVATIGSEGLATELRGAGLDLVESSPDAVVVGAADDTGYADIQHAARLIRAGAPFVGTNPDGFYPTPDGPAPGTGAIVKAVEIASATRPTVVGKPSPRMFEVALEFLPDANAVVVGDNPETDILGAHRAGLVGALVGDRAPVGAGANDFRTPDATVPDLRGLFDSDVTARRWIRPEYDWPDDVVATVAAVVRDDAGRVLSVADGDGGWTLPTGSVQRLETVADAARRVVSEQAGLDVEVEGFLGVYSDPEMQVVARPDGEIVQQVTTCLSCSALDGELDGDGTFVDPSELPADLDRTAASMLEDALSSFDGPAIR